MINLRANNAVRTGHKTLILLLTLIMLVLMLLLPFDRQGIEDTRPMRVNPAYASDQFSEGTLIALEERGTKASLHEPIAYPDIAPPVQRESVATAIGFINYDGVPVAGATVTLAGPTATLTATTQPGPLSDDPYFTATLSAPPLNALPDDLLKMGFGYSDQENITSFQVVSGQQELYGYLSSTCGPTEINDPLISTNTVWTPECGPYRVHQNLMIQSAVALTVSAGTTVEFDPGRALVAEGFLYTAGSSNALVTFTSPNPAPGEWGYLQINTASFMSGALVEYAGGVDLENSAAIRVDGGEATLNRVIVRSSARDGIQIYDDGDVEMHHLLVADNAGWGIVAESPMSNIGIYDSSVQFNGEGGIWIKNTFIGTIYTNYIADNLGSGILVDNSNLYINIAGNIICRNLDSNGAGIYFRDSGIIENNFIWDNEAVSRGGGLYVFASDAEIKNNFVLENRAQNTLLGGGGLNVWPVNDEPVAYNNVIVGNSTLGDGGGLYTTPAHDFGFWSNSVLRNHADGRGGAVYAEYPDYINFSIESNTILENTAGVGQGAIHLTAKSDPISNNNLDNNSDYALFYGAPYAPENLLNAQQNWWGTDVIGEIPALIWDWYDDAALAQVDYTPPLVAPSITAPVTPPQDFVSAADGFTITLEWSPNLETDLAGYHLYFGTSDNLEIDAILGNVAAVDLGMATAVTITDVPLGIYHMAVTAYDLEADGDHDWRQGHESWFSRVETVIIGDTPQASFYAQPLSGTPPLTVDFTDTSTGDFDSWYWTFGDGETSTEQHPTHVYTAMGAFTVTLTVDGPTGSDSDTKPGYITVAPGIFVFLPVAMR